MKSGKNARFLALLVLSVIVISIGLYSVSLYGSNTSSNSVQGKNAHLYFAGPDSPSVTSSTTVTTINTTSSSLNATTITPSTTTSSSTTITIPANTILPPTNQTNETSLSNATNTTSNSVGSQIVTPAVVIPKLVITGSSPSSVTLDSNQTRTFQIGVTSGIASSYSWGNTGELSVISGCQSTDTTCTVTAQNVTSQYLSSVYASASSLNGTSNPVTWNVIINPQLDNIYANIAAISPDGSSYSLISAATGGTPPYQYTWTLQGGLAPMSGCGTASNNATCVINDQNATSQSAVILTVTDNATVPVTIVDWHISSVTLSPQTSYVSSEGSTTFTVTTVLASGTTPNMDIETPTINYDWIPTTSGTPVASVCPTTGGLVITCTINSPVVSSLTVYGFKVMPTSAVAVVDNQSSNPDSGACTYLSGTGSQQKYTCTYSIGSESLSSNIIDYPLLTTTLFANKTTVAVGKSISFTNITTGGSGGNVFTLSINNTAGVVQNGNIFKFNLAGKYNVSLSVKDSINEIAKSWKIISVNETLSVNASTIPCPGVEVCGVPTYSRDQIIKIFDSGAFGGVPPYTYQWEESLPSNPNIEINALDCGPGNSPASTPTNCTFVTNSITPVGQYDFVLTATDSETPRVTAFENSVQKVNVVTGLQILNFMVNRTLISGDQEVSFTNNTINGTGDDVYSYNVVSVPPGGSMNSLGNGKYSFTQPGTYTIIFNVLDQSYETANASVTVQVNKTLETTLIPNRTLISTNQSVSFSSNTIGGTGGRVFTYAVSCTPSGNYVITNNVINFIKPGSCTVTGNVIDQSGEFNSSNAVITITPPLTTNVIANRTLVSTGQSIKFSNVTLNGTGTNKYNYTSSCTGLTANTAGNIWQFNTAGNCIVTFHVSDISGETNQSNVMITVTPPLVTTLNANWTTISAGQSVKVWNVTTGGTGNTVYTYTYDCNGVTNVANVFTFNDQGSCNITLNVSDISGETNQSNVLIGVTPPLLVTTFTNTTRKLISAGQSVSFANTITGGTGNNILTYFVNGKAATSDLNGSLTFPTAGNFVVTLGVSDQTGEVANSLANVIVTVTPPLAIKLKANWTYISAGQKVLFTNTTLNGTGGNIYSYIYTCNGATNAGNKFTFANAVTCNVALHVTDASGETNQSNATIIVTPPLEITLTANRTLISTGQIVGFSNTITGGTANETYSYTTTCAGTAVNGNAITFNDVSTKCGVTIHVTDTTNEINQSTVNITVTPQLVTTLTANRTLISAGQWIKFTNVTTAGTGNNIYSYTSSCTGVNANTINGNIWQFNTAGNCIVTLHVSDISGETNQSNVMITVTPPLVTTLNANWTTISAGQSVKVWNVTTGGTGNTIYTYIYDCIGATNAANVFTFADAGTCNITLHVSDISGETNQSNVLITITKPLTIPTFTANRTLISTGQWISFANATSGGTGNNIYSYTTTCENAVANAINGNIWQFNTAGKNCTVTIHVTDLTGETNQSNATIIVTPPLVTTLTANRSTISAGQWIKFSNVTTGGTGNTIYTYTSSCGNTIANIQNGNIWQFDTAANCIVTEHVLDLSGETNQSNVSIIVTAPLAITTFTASKTLISADQTVIFTNTTSGGTGGNSYEYGLSCKNGGVVVVGGYVISGNSVTFTEPENCTTVLNVTDASGEFNQSSTINITVTPPLVTTLHANATFISADQSVKVWNITTGGTGSNVYTYTVNNTNGVTQTGNVFSFNTAGKYKITLNVTDISGENASSWVVINVTPSLITKIYANRTLISEGQAIQVWNVTTGGTGSNVYTYTLNNTNDVVISGNVYAFNTPGNYLITISANDLSGEASSSNVLIVVTNTLGIKLFESKAKVVQNQPVYLTNVTTGGTGNNIYYYTISNTLGVTFNGNKVTFADVGLYNITIHVTDISGEVNQSSNTVIVDEPVLINSSYTQTPLVSRDQIINITSSGAVGNSGVGPYTYLWLYALPHHVTFNPATICENDTSTTCIIQTNANTPVGQYEFVLQVTDSESPKITTNAAPLLITVTNALTINSFTATPNSINAGQSVTLTNVTEGGTGDDVFTYTFSPSTDISTTGNNVYTFANAGNYIVTLNVVDQTGENATANVAITVGKPIPPLTTTLTNTSRVVISAGQSVNFSNVTSGGTGGNVFTYFVDGSVVSTTGNVIVFPTAGNFVVTLGVTDSASNTLNSLGINVIVTAPLVITSFTSNALGPISADQSVLLSNTTSGGTGSNVYTYTYDCDGVTNTGNAFNFTSATTCKITLHVSDASGETNESNITISSTPLLTTEILNTSRTTISAGQSVSFTNFSTGGTGNDVNTYFLNGNAITLVGNSIAFPSAGNFVVTLGTTDASGEAANDFVGITVTVTKPLEITSFIPNETSISGDQSVSFTNTTSGGTGGNKYTYSVNNGINGTDYIISGNSIAFQTEGNYIVTLTVNDVSGETNQSSTAITVTPGLTTETLNTSRTLISAGQSVSFTNFSTGGTGNDVNTYFLNGNAITLVGNSVTFPSTGNFVVTLGTTDASGETANDFVGINVIVTPPLEITSFTTSTNTISADQSVLLSNTTSGGTGSNVYTYTDDCDGVTNTGNTFTFNSATTCKITLHVSDASGETNESNITISSTPMLTTEILNTSRTLISAGQSVSFTNLSTGGTGNDVNTYFLNGNVVTLIGNSITFPSAGNDVVTLGTTDVSGEVANALVGINVIVTPGLTISISPGTANVDAGQTIDYTNITTGGTGTNVYTYTENTLGCATQTANAFKFNTVGACQITIHVTDISGEQANATSDVTVVPLPVITLAANTTLIDAGHFVSFTNVTTGGTPPYVAYAYTVNSLTGVSASGNILSFDDSGNYLVTENVIDSANGMATSNPVIIDVNPELIPILLSASNALVDQGQFETITGQATGGTSPYTYQFTISNAINGNTIITYTAFNVPEGISNSFTFNTGNAPILNDELGSLNVEMTVKDAVNTVVFSGLLNGIDDPVIKSAAELGSNLTVVPQSIDLNESTLLTVNIAGGNGPYTYNFVVTNSTGKVIFQQINSQVAAQTSSVSYTSTPNSIGLDNVSVMVQDATNNPSLPCSKNNGCEILSNTMTVSNTTYVPSTPTTTIPNGGGGGVQGSGGSGVSGGLSSGGGGSSTPVVTIYTNGSQSGYELTNLTTKNSEVLNLSNNKTINVTLNFIDPSSAGITVNGNTYTLTLGNVTTLVDPNNYTFYAKLLNISYQPIEHTVTLLIYGQPNAPGTITIAQNVTPVVQTAPATTTILPTPVYTSTISQSVQTAGTSAQGSSTPAPVSSVNYLLIGLGVLIVVVVVAVIASQISSQRKSGKKTKN